MDRSKAPAFKLEHGGKGENREASDQEITSIQNNNDWADSSGKNKEIKRTERHNISKYRLLEKRKKMKYCIKDKKVSLKEIITQKEEHSSPQKICEPQDLI